VIAVDEKIRSKLRSLFNEDQKKVEAADKAADLQNQREAEFKAEFMRVRDETIKPAMKEVADFVADNGWVCDIISVDEEPNSGSKPSIRISFFRGQKPSYYEDYNYPHFTMYWDQSAQQVHLAYSTIGPNHGGSSGGAGTVKLREVTSEMVQDKIADFLTQLVRDAEEHRR
jgi:hypothetical protein